MPMHSSRSLSRFFPKTRVPRVIPLHIQSHFGITRVALIYVCPVKLICPVSANSLNVSETIDLKDRLGCQKIKDKEVFDLCKGPIRVHA